MVYGDDVAPSGATTRRMFARIRLVSAGVPVQRNATPQPVPFMVTIEPLLFGVIPGSVIPTVACLLFVGLAAGFLVVPPVNRYLGEVAERVRAKTAVARSRKER